MKSERELSERIIYFFCTWDNTSKGFRCLHRNGMSVLPYFSRSSSLSRHKSWKLAFLETDNHRLLPERLSNWSNWLNNSANTSHLQNVIGPRYSIHSLLLWKPQVLYLFQKSPPEVRNSYWIQFTYSETIYLKTSLILSSHLRSYFPKLLSALSFQAETFVWISLFQFLFYNLLHH